MTLRQAQAAAAIAITPDMSMGLGSTCITARVEGLDLWFMVEASGQPGEDPMNGVIGSVHGGRRTAEGVAIGDPIAKVDQSMDPPPARSTTPTCPTARCSSTSPGASPTASPPTAPPSRSSNQATPPGWRTSRAARETGERGGVLAKGKLEPAGAGNPGREIRQWHAAPRSPPHGNRH
jgi:hypothetical protein